MRHTRSIGKHKLNTVLQLYPSFLKHLKYELVYALVYDKN